jgi:hypothetical protein
MAPRDRGVRLYWRIESENDKPALSLLAGLA